MAHHRSGSRAACSRQHEVEVSLDGERVHAGRRSAATADYRPSVLNAGAIDDRARRAPAGARHGDGRAARRRRHLHRDRGRRARPAPSRCGRRCSPSIRSTSTASAGIEQRDHRRAVQPDRRRRHAEPSRRSSSAAATATSAGRERACARTHPRRRWRGARTGGRSTDARPAAADASSTSTGRAGAAASSRASRSALQRILRARFPVPRRAAIRRRSPPAPCYRISDLELASRLSFFLWSSIPDEELLTLAAQGALSQPAVLEQQVRRMLADPRGRARSSATSPGSGCTCATSQSVRAGPRGLPGVRRQPAAGVAARDRAVLRRASCARTAASLDLLTPTTRSSTSGWRATTACPASTAAIPARALTDAGARRACSARAACSTVTSYPNRTSPVVRGKWMLENMLGAPPPPPPPDVPPLADTASSRQDHARADGGAPRQPGLRDVPPRDGSRSGSRSRTSTRSAPGARSDGDGADRCRRHARRRHEGRRPGRACGRRC